MKHTPNKIGIIVILILTLFIPAASAAPFWMDFRNEFQADNIYLFIIDDKVTFQDVNEKQLASTWTLDTKESNRLIFSGNALNPNQGIFRIQFSINNDPFIMEWAEVLNGVIQPGHSGTLTFNNKRQIVNSAYGPITSAVPIPESIWLLGSALVCFIGIRRKAVQA